MLWKLLFPLVFPICLLAQQESPILALSPYGSYSGYGPSLGFRSSFGYGLHVIYSPFLHTAVSARISLSRTSVEFDLINAQDRIDVGVISYQLGIRQQIASVGLLFDIDLSGNVGMISFVREAKTISLGALGATVIPEKTDTRSIYSVGMILSRAIGSQVSIDVMPEVQFISPLSERQGNYSISGGLAIGIL